MSKFLDMPPGLTLPHNDYLSIVPGCVAQTPNGRDVRRRTDGRLEVQPHNDNYWIAVDSLEQAMDAYYNPGKFR